MIIAGETSGDLHGGMLVRELRKLDPGLEVYGIGGENMQAAGMDLLYHVREFSVMGFAEVLGHLPFIQSAFRRLETELDQRRPDLLVLIDYPGFNLRLAKAAKDRDLSVVYYISPQVWAWGGHRVRRIRKLVDRMLCILPFEEEFYRSRGVPARYVGNPLLDMARPAFSREAFARKHGLSPSQPLVGLLPGSRRQEVEKILPVLLGACKMLKEQQPSLQFVLGLAPDIGEDGITAHARRYGIRPAIAQGESYDLMAHSDLVLAASGTATLECGIIGTPLIVVYKTSWLSYLLGRMLVKVPFIGLVNLVCGKQVAPEFIQQEARPGAIFLMSQMLLAPGRPREAVRAELARIPGLLGQPGAARRAAAEVLETLGRKRQPGA
jgi:lipid-A-disaccharide synthase